MAQKQELVCPECKVKFEFDPDSDVKIITSLNAPVTKSFRIRGKKDIVVTAFLECPNGHNKPYKVTKEY